MKDNFCKVFTDEGVYCGNKAVQHSNGKYRCRKHKLSKDFQEVVNE